MMTANWWYYNQPGTEYYDPAKARQEAANFVEYCNGSVTTIVETNPNVTVLEKAIRDGWQPSRFVDDPQFPENQSVAVTAVEWADGVHSWLSTQQAPKGYFAWLRRYFAWLRLPENQRYYGDNQPKWKSLTEFPEPSYGAPYGFRYWEIGTEVPAHFWGARSPAWLYATDADAYRNSITGTSPDYMGWCKAMKMANSADGVANITSTDVVENQPYQGKRLKIGASMDDWATFYWPTEQEGNRFPKTFGQVTFSLTNNPHTLSVWDTAILNSGSAKFIDFAVTHPGAGTHDDRYSDTIHGPGGSLTSLSFTVTSPANYTFWIRAKGTPRPDASLDDYPQMTATLVSTGDPVYLSATDVPDPDHPGQYFRTRYDETTYWVVHPSEGAPPIFTAYADQLWKYGCDPECEYARSDYRFNTPGQLAAGTYQLKLEIMNGSGEEPDPPSIAVQMASCQPEGGAETVLEFRAPGDQTAAVFAAARILGIRTQTLKSHIDSLLPGKDIELAATSYGYAWTFTAYPDQARNLKGLLAVADNWRQLVDNGVDVANYSELNNSGKSIPQPRRTWDPITRTWDNPAPNTFFASPVQQFLKMLSTHFGDEKVTATVQNSPTFDHSALYDSIAPVEDIPYISARGSRSLHSSGTYYDKLYALVINKKTDDLTCDVAFEGVTMPTQIVPHVLKCWEQVPDLLEAQNAYGSNRIYYQTGSELDFSYNADTQTVNLVDYELPAASVTVLEFTLSPPVSYLYTLGPNSPVDLRGKFVSATFGDGFYIQEPNRTAGIAVLKTNHGRSVGDLVSVSGSIITTADGERAISNYPGVTLIDTAHEVRPLGMRNEWLGGESPNQYTPGPYWACGLYNVGLLTQTWGEVTAVDEVPPLTYFYIDDGSDLIDGSGNEGVRVLFAPPQNLAVDDYVKVKGVSGLMYTEPNYHRILKPRSDGDIVEITVEEDAYELDVSEGDNYLTLPAIPFPNHPYWTFMACPNKPGIPIDGKLNRWATGEWVTYHDCGGEAFGNCLLADGYRLPYTGSLSRVCYEGTPAPGDQWISLPLAGTQYIGSPLDADVSWSACRFTDGLELKTPAEAVASGWIDKQVWYNGPGPVDDVYITDPASVLSRGVAYQATTHKDELALIVPGSQ
jgi:hypothetical protein